MTASRPAGAPLGPTGLPLLGSLVPFGRDPLGFCERVFHEYGDVAHFRIVEHDLWLLSHPDDIEQVLVKDAKVLHKDAIYDLLLPVLGRGLVTAEDDLWKRHRKLLAPVFTRRQVDAYGDTMVRCTREWLAGRRAGGEVDAHHEMMMLTQRIVLETVFGTDLDVDAVRAAHAIDVVMETFVTEAQGVGRVLPKWLPTRSRRRAKVAIADLDRTIFALITARRARGLGDDLLSRLLGAKDEEGGLSDQEVRDEAVTAFVAGHETTALALTWTFVLLGENPRVWEPLEAEAAQVLGDRAATSADLAALPYTTAVVKETLRLLPPVWAVGRMALQDLDVRGQVIPKGHNILLSQWVVQRDPRWFPEPLLYRPERWLDAARVDALPRMAWFPFGGGPRVCIGNHFAMLEAVLILATLARSGRLRTVAARPPLQPSITLRPVGPVPARWEPAPRPPTH